MLGPGQVLVGSGVPLRGPGHRGAGKLGRVWQVYLQQHEATAALLGTMQAE